tara:strand:- start:5676 stop:5891 length:216 start_codon:yes stop_codon:yes gene_type:complete
MPNLVHDICQFGPATFDGTMGKRACKLKTCQDQNKGIYDGVLAKGSQSTSKGMRESTIVKAYKDAVTFGKK